MSTTSGVVGQSVPYEEQRQDRHGIRPWSPVNSDERRLNADRGKNDRLWDEQGDEYIDASSLNAACGYSRPEVVQAASTQLARLQSVDLSVHDNSVAEALATRLSGLLGPALPRILFTNSGSEGIEAACFMAASYYALQGQRRTRVVTFARGYHGSTSLTRALSSLPPTEQYFNSPLHVTPVEIPGTDRFVRDTSMTSTLLEAFSDAIGSDAEDLPMAVLIEPLLNVGGGVILPPGLLAGIRAMCDERGVLLIIDEVFTGVGRTGRMFGFQHEEITPDIVVSSKGLSGGFAPLAAVAVSENIYQSFVADPIGVRYGHTTSGHAVACASSLAVLDIIEDENLVENARQTGSLLLEAIADIAKPTAVEDVRGLGMLVVVELSSYERASALVRHARNRGLLLRQQGNAVMVVPPLTIGASDVNEIARRFDLAFNDFTR